MADAVAQFRELAEARDQRLLVPKRASKQRPERLVDDRVLELAQIEVLELAGERPVVVTSSAGFFFAAAGAARLPSANVGGQLRGVAVQASSISLRRPARPPRPARRAREVRRQVKPLLHQQVLDRVLERPLALGKKLLEVVWRERVAQEDLEGRRRDEVRLKDRPNGGLAVLP